MLIHPRPHALTPRIPLARRGGWGLWPGGARSLVWAPGFLDPQTGSHEGGAPGTLPTGVNRRCLRPWVCAWVPAADRGRVAMPPVHAAQRVPRLHVRPHPAAFFSCAPHSPTARRILNGSSVYHTDSPGAHDLVPGPSPVDLAPPSTPSPKADTRSPAYAVSQGGGGLGHVPPVSHVLASLLTSQIFT